MYKHNDIYRTTHLFKAANSGILGLPLTEAKQFSNIRLPMTVALSQNEAWVSLDGVMSDDYAWLVDSVPEYREHLVSKNPHNKKIPMGFRVNNFEDIDIDNPKSFLRRIYTYLSMFTPESYIEGMGDERTLKNGLKTKEARMNYKGERRYFPRKIQDVAEDLVAPLQSLVSSKKSQEVEADYAKMWEDFVNRIGEEDVRSLLASLGGHLSGDMGSNVGWTLSKMNAILCITQFQKANNGAVPTFVKTASQWRDDYNRKVDMNATPMYIRMGGGEATKDFQKSVIDKLIQAGVNTSRRTAQMNDVIINRAKQEYQDRYGRTDTFPFMVVYDVSQTTLIPGKEDIFNTEVGLESNLQGTANAKAMEQYGDDEKSDEIKKELRNKDLYGGRQNDVRVAYYAIFFSPYQNKLGSALKPDASEKEFESECYRMLTVIADDCAQRFARIQKSTNREKIVKTAVLIAMQILGIAPEFVAQQAMNQNLNKNAIVDVNRIVETILDNVDKANGKRMLERMLGKDNTTTVKENYERFFDIYDKINRKY